jgi:hypothetical protein
MATQLTMYVGDEKFEVEARQLNIVCQSPESAVGPPIRYENCVVLSCQETLYHAERLQKPHAQFREVWEYFMHGVNGPSKIDPTPDNIRQGGMGGKHLMGLFDMTLKLQDKGVTVVWRTPESFLHPGWQVGLGDVAIYFSRRANEGVQTAPAPTFELVSRKIGDEVWEKTGITYTVEQAKSLFGVTDREIEIGSSAVTEGEGLNFEVYEYRLTKVS